MIRFLENKSQFFYKQKRYLPGDKLFSENKERILKVNHAGELGAVCIYKGQLLVLKKHPSAKILKHMLEQEKKHLTFFEKELLKNSFKPSLLLPFWKFSGFILGVITGMMGLNFAMLCTVAVEEVINRHYLSQEIFLLLFYYQY